jgi:hypothetical protein
LKTFFQLSGIKKDSKETKARMNYIMNSSLFTEIFAEAFPELIIFLINEFGSKTSEVGSATFWFALSTSIFSIINASYPLLRHMYLEGSVVNGLKTPRYVNKDLVIRPLFDEEGEKMKLFSCKCKCLKRKPEVQQQTEEGGNNNTTRQRPTVESNDIELNVQNPMSNPNNNINNSDGSSNDDDDGDDEEARRRARRRRRRRKRRESKNLKFPVGSTVKLKDDENETLTVTKYNAETKEYTCKYDDDDVEDVFEENELVLQRPD